MTCYRKKNRQERSQALLPVDDLKNSSRRHRRAVYMFVFVSRFDCQIDHKSPNAHTATAIQ